MAVIKLAAACIILLSQTGIGAADDLDAAGRAKMAEMTAFIRHAPDSCPKAVPDLWIFEALALNMSIKPPVSEDEIVSKEKYLNGLRSKIGYVKWCALFAVEMEQAHMIAAMHAKGE
jgi:hypothetical protein